MKTIDKKDYKALCDKYDAWDDAMNAVQEWLSVVATSTFLLTIIAVAVAVVVKVFVRG